MFWPQITDYHEAIQSPKICLSDPELRAGNTILNRQGLPKVASGNFAVVYQVDCGAHKYAVKCFHRYPQDQEQRYDVISKCLNQITLSYMIEFQFQAQGIRIKGKWYPILKMEWIEGDQLNQYIEKNLRNPDVLVNLAGEFCNLTHSLKSHGIAHCDLQHGNIIVRNSKLKLIDYDGMFVPGLSNMPSNEIGHSNFQHPSRNENDFGVHLDNFSAWVIYVSLIALSKDPGLWTMLDAGEESLLFKKADFLNPDLSTAFTVLEQNSNQELALLIKQFRSFTESSNLSNIPLLPKPIQVSPPVQQPIAMPPHVSVHTGVPWWEDHIEQKPVEIGKSFFMERSYLLGLAIAIVAVLILNVSGVIPFVTFPFFAGGLASLCLYLFYRRFQIMPEYINKMHKINEYRSQTQHSEIMHQKIVDLEDYKNKTETEETTEIEPIELKLKNITESLKRELDILNSDLRAQTVNIDYELKKLANDENRLIDSELKKLQNQYLERRLRNYTIGGAAIYGIGKALINRLNAEGFITAADISGIIIVNTGGSYSNEIAQIHHTNGQIKHINGIGPQKAREIERWHQNLKSQFVANMPKNLLPSLEASIRANCKTKKTNLENQRGIIIQNSAQKINSVKAKYNQEQITLSKQLQAVKTKFDLQKQNIERNISQEHRAFEEKRQSIERLKKDIVAYRQVNFRVYLKKTIGR